MGLSAIEKLTSINFLDVSRSSTVPVSLDSCTVTSQISFPASLSDNSSYSLKRYFMLLPRKLGSVQMILAMLSFLMFSPSAISFSASETLSGTAMQSAFLFKFVIKLFPPILLLSKNLKIPHFFQKTYKKFRLYTISHEL